MAENYTAPNDNSFNIYVQIAKELESFYKERVSLAGMPDTGNELRFLPSQNKNYSFNQYETINLINLYYNSKFESGPTDKQGKQKLFLNVGKFRTEVASKQIDIDTKDFAFIPEDYADNIGAYLMQAEFHQYAKQSYFGELINECVDAFPKYGTVVLKKVGKKLEFVPLETLRNDQCAKDLGSASFVIEEHCDMTMADIQMMAKNGWVTEDFSMPFGKTTTIYERTGFMPRVYFNKIKGIKDDKADPEEIIDTVLICTIDKSPRAKKMLDVGYVFYCEEIDERPYREAHWSKQHGRWLGVGVMEAQFENQKAKNILVNFQKRAAEWSSKRVWASADPNVAQQLISQVEDGTVLQVMPNASVTQVDMSSKSGADFQQMLNEWEKNSDQNAFTYEVATGEALPSGTPFRLGVILANSVNSFFALKREKLGILLKKAMMDLLIPEFKKEMQKGNSVVVLHADSPGFNVLIEAAKNYTMTQAVRASIFSGKLVDPVLIQQLVTPVMIAKEIFVNRTKEFYNDIEYKFDLTITGEEVNLDKKITSLTTLYQVLAQQQNPMASQVLDRILALTGENLGVYRSSAPAAPAGGMPSVNPQTPISQLNPQSNGAPATL